MFWMWGRRRSGSPDTGPANSGLTGDPVIEEPPDQGPKDWRTRWRTLKESVRGTTAALPQVLRLVWDASPGVTAGLFAATVVAGVIPAISAYTSKLLVNSVVRGIVVHQGIVSGKPVPDQVRLDLGPWHPVYTALNAIIFLAVLQLLIFALIAFLSELYEVEQRAILLIWDGLPSHRSRRMSDWVASRRLWLSVERLPGYAPDLNPIENVWGNLKSQELANLCADALDEVADIAEEGLDRIGTDAGLCLAFLRHSGLRL